MSELLARDEIIEQAAQVVQSGRLALLTSENPEQLSSLLGDIAVSMMEFGADVVRVDALGSPTAADLISAMCDYLGVSGQELITGLRIRGETGNPVCLVIDNGECLEGKALDVMRKFLEATSCGVGVLVGGEPDASLYLSDAGIAVPLTLDVDAHDVGASDADYLDNEGGTFSWQLLPWRHIAAAAGLGLLVWLFWPAEPAHEDETRELALPEQAGAAPAPEFRQLYDHVDPKVAEASPASEPAPQEVKAPVAKVAPEPVVAPAPEPTPEPTVVAKPVPKPAPKPAPAPVAKAAPVTKPAPQLSGLSAELGYHQEEWLLTQAPGSWMLQVALANDENGARQMLDQIGRSRSAYYRAERSGRQVFIVLAGAWNTREAAVTGKSALPAALQQLGPFPRDLAAIQKEIGANP